MSNPDKEPIKENELEEAYRILQALCNKENVDTRNVVKAISIMLREQIASSIPNTQLSIMELSDFMSQIVKNAGGDIEDLQIEDDDKNIIVDIKDIPLEILSMNIAELFKDDTYAIRLFNLLKSYELTIMDVLKKTKAEMLAYKNFGIKMFEQLDNKLKELSIDWDLIRTSIK